MKNKKYKNFNDFYPFYLSQHQNKWCRICHYIGSCFAIYFLVKAFVTLSLINLLYALIVGYAFAWVGHFFFEKNRPATFTYPWYSFLGDWRMFFRLITGRNNSNH